MGPYLKVQDSLVYQYSIIILIKMLKMQLWQFISVLV